MGSSINNPSSSKGTLVKYAAIVNGGTYTPLYANSIILIIAKGDAERAGGYTGNNILTDSIAGELSRAYSAITNVNPNADCFTLTYLGSLSVASHTLTVSNDGTMSIANCDIKIMEFLSP